MGDPVIIDALPINSENYCYFYKAIIGRPNKPHLPAVPDADTIHLAEFDMGRERVEKNVSLRLCWVDGAYFDAWETRGRKPKDLTEEEWTIHREKGAAARDFLRPLLPDGTKIIVATNRDKDGTFRDLVGAPFIPLDDGKFIDVCMTLDKLGHTKEKRYP